MTRVALVVGATGLVGRAVVGQLMADSRWSRVVVLARRDPDAAGEKLDARVVDFEALADGGAATSLDGVEDLFACLGTTIKVAGSEERFRRVDHGYTLAVARLAKAAGARRIALVSSVGASAAATSFYLRVKGETERDISALGYQTVVIARPSFLVGERSERRPGERAAIAVSSVLSPLMLGGLRVYRPIAAADVARALVRAIAADSPGEVVLTHSDMTGDRAGASR